MKKFLSIVLALVMMMALALPAFAADEIVVKTYDELKNAIDNTDASEINIKLGSNITTDVAISGRDSHTVKINLNGYTLSPSSFETNWGHTLIICDSSKKPGYIIGRNISNRGTIIIRDVNVNIDNATNKGLLYITGKHSKVSKFRLDAGSNSSAFVGKGMASASYLPDSKKDSLVIVEVDDIAGVSEVNQTGTVVYMDFNNAGNAHGLAPFDEADLDDLEAMIDINVKGLIYVSKAVIPLIKKSKNGHIVNISSIAGKEVYANGTTYCASKAAVESLSKGMRYDLLPYGVKVTNVAPGAVETEFSLVRFKGDEEKSSNVYKGFEPLVAEDIADAIAYALNAPQHVQIADVTIFPKAQAGGTTIFKG